MKKLLALGMIVLLVTLGLVFALPTLPATLPHAAKTASPAIDDAGELHAPPEFVADLPESQLTKIVFIRYAPGFQKEKPCNNDGVCDPDEKGWCDDCKGGEEEPTPSPSPCYDFLAGSKPRWNWVEDYYYSDSSLAGPSASAVTTWEGVPDTRDIFGAGSYATGYNWGVYDYANSLSYGDYDDTGMCPTADPCVIAVTVIWFRGKNIYEYDIMFDTDYFPGSTDLPTVTLHEFGHAAGLNDLYDVACEAEVMYWQYTVLKTTLGSGDIAGIQKLYG